MNADAARRARLTARDAAYIGAFVPLLAACAWISVPASVPFTLQTLGVFSAVGVLGGKRGTLAVLVYLLLGAAGLPVFSGFRGGLGVLLGATGGYVAGFLGAALLMWGAEALFGRRRGVLALSMIAGLLLCYALGTLWFVAVYAKTAGPVGFGAALLKCVVPFLLPDALKIALALLLTGRLRRALPRQAAERKGDVTK
jgi:biotin transport system substrate-specific component